MTAHCNSVQGLLSAYIDDEVSVEERNTVEAHLRLCRECQSVLGQLQDMSNLLQMNLGHVTAPDKLDQNVLAAIRASRQEAQVRRLSILYVACAGFTTVGIIVFLLSPVAIMLRALIRMTVPMIRLILSLLPSMGYSGIATVMVSCIVVALLSIVGFYKVLRSTRTEGVV